MSPEPLGKTCIPPFKVKAVGRAGRSGLGRDFKSLTPLAGDQPAPPERSIERRGHVLRVRYDIRQPANQATTDVSRDSSDDAPVALTYTNYVGMPNVIRLVKDGDWIQFDQYGADGEIEELGLNTVKVRNWDKTITTVPTYALISQSFKNWRGMQESGGRRIKRAIHLDLNSIRLIDSDFLETLKSNEFITQVLSNEELNNAKAQSNVKLFRAYAEEYLRQHEALNHNLTLMVRELAPSAEGLPVELYCFSADKRWIPYEHLQADIMDHLLASLTMFGLRPYQHVTGQLTG